MLKSLILVLLLASGLRFTALTFDSLWLDESYQTVVESYGNPLPDLFNPTLQTFIYTPEKPASIKTVLSNFRKVDPLCPPLYAILMNRWLTIFGGNDFSLRAFSALCSVLSIAATYIFGASLLGKRAGLFAALLQAISPFDIAYAQEARMYSLSTLLATLSGGSFLSLCLKPRSSASFLLSIIYILATCALVNTHYTQIFFWAFTILSGFAIAIFRKDLYLFSLVLASNICIGILFIPWLSLFMQAASVRTASFYVARQPSFFWPIWAFFIRIPFNWLVFLAGKKVMLWASPAYITALAIIAYAAKPLIDNFKELKANKANRDNTTLNQTDSNLNLLPVLMIFAWAILPAAMVWTMDIIESHRVIEISRYVIGTAPAIFLLGGYSLSLLFTKKIFFPLLISHSIFCLSNNAYLHIIHQKENWREIANQIEQNIKPNEILYVSNYYNILCLDRYLHQPLPQIGISPALGTAGVQKIFHDTANKSISNTFWVLSAQEGDAIFSLIPQEYTIIEQRDFGHALHLKHYKKPQL